MSDKFIAHEHEVVAVKITKLAPLLGRGGNSVTAPDFGLELVLENGRRIKWLSEGHGAPTVADFYVEDSVLGISFICSAAKFAELFSQQEV